MTIKAIIIVDKWGKKVVSLTSQPEFPFKSIKKFMEQVYDANVNDMAPLQVTTEADLIDNCHGTWTCQSWSGTWEVIDTIA